jgi:2-polyprenyl-6-hydroxyphenyl methylase/3-demethylubiquinone-9 3-methyltransferase
MPASIRRLIDLNRRVSRWERSVVSRLVPGCAADGTVDFRDRVLPSLIRPGMRVLDVGGGKEPAISPAMKQRYGLHITGLDVSAAELEQAPPGSFDGTIVGDVATVSIPGGYDLIFSRAVLEHVADPRAAISNLAKALAPGGTMAHFMPCGNAPFAVLNRMLGNRAARRLLFSIFPEKAKGSGFRAFYRDCTPSRLLRICRENGLELDKVFPYFNSDYTSFFAPIYTVETLRQALMCSLRLDDFAESFAVVVRAPLR